MTTTTPTPNPPISSEQARKLVNRFLLMDVSTMLAAATPELVIGARTLWRAPVWIGFLQQGHGAVGAASCLTGSKVSPPAGRAPRRLRQRCPPVAPMRSW